MNIDYEQREDLFNMYPQSKMCVNDMNNDYSLPEPPAKNTVVEMIDSRELGENCPVRLNIIKWF